MMKSTIKRSYLLLIMLLGGILLSIVTLSYFITPSPTQMHPDTSHSEVRHSDLRQQLVSLRMHNALRFVQTPSQTDVPSLTSNHDIIYNSQPENPPASQIDVLTIDVLAIDQKVAAWEQEFASGRAFVK
ncbi:hypothetical protein PN836_001725 [Ningiella sp. W23]|uniref:hypothetical protein n=1 Tax=Ningiella sp. W23 TaxID=3023715 RepID=UPI003756430E